MKVNIMKKDSAYNRAKRDKRTPEQVEAARAYQRVYAAARYARLRAAKLCINCETPTERVYCKACKPRLPKKPSKQTLDKGSVETEQPKE